MEALCPFLALACVVLLMWTPGLSVGQEKERDRNKRHILLTLSPFYLRRFPENFPKYSPPNISLDKEMATSSVFLLGKSHGQRKLAGYSPQGHKKVRHDLVIKQ